MHVSHYSFSKKITIDFPFFPTPTEFKAAKRKHSREELFLQVQAGIPSALDEKLSVQTTRRF